MQYAAIRGTIGTFELLLEHGADIDAPASKVYGRKPIEGASEHGRFDMVQYLCRLRKPVPAELQSAMRLANDHGHRAIAEFLESTLQELPTLSPVLTESRRKRHFCDVCQIPFSNASARARHRRTRHNDDAPYFECDICGRPFNRGDMMNRHRATHDKHGYHHCDLCGNEFRKDHYKSHLPACQQRHAELMAVD